MAEDKNYFDGEINEFVDWVSGDSEISGNATGGKPVSGGAIRRFLQSRAQKPIVLEYNSVAGKNRIFPSAYARDLYNSDPDKYAKYLIAEFEAAAEYTIKLYSDAACTNEVDASNRDIYIKSGDSTNDNNSFKMYYKIFKGDEEYTSNIYVQAVVRNSNYKTSTIGSNFSSGQQIDINLSSLIHEGSNTIEITIGAFVGTQVFQKNIRYTIHVVDLSVSVKYDYNKSAGNNSNNLTFSVFTKNTSGADVTTVYKIDQGQEGINTSVNSNQYTQYSPDISALDEGIHTLQVMSYISVNNNNVSQFIHSNIVYIRFVKYTGQTSLHNIVFYCSIDDRTSLLIANEVPTLYFTQYGKASLDWALASTATSILKNVTWKLQKYIDEVWEDVNTYEYSVGKETINSLNFPLSTYGDNYRLVGLLDGVEEIVFGVVIKNAKFQISETGNYNLKLDNEQGFNNNNPLTRKWISNYNNNHISCLFNRERAQDAESPAFPWNSISGWGKDCMHISPNDYVYIPYRFFSHGNSNAEVTGATIEIEFEFRNITDPNDELIVIGGENNKSKIVFTPTSATLYSDNNTYLVRTNFKANERIKLAFVINPNTNAGDDTSLAMIVNNGILERANSYSNTFTATKGIKIGKSNAGADIYIYKIRAYNSALSPEQLFCNYALDNDNTADIIQNNNILSRDNNIDYNSVLNKLPVIFITGRMSDIIGSTGKTMNLNVDLAKIDMSDTSHNIFIKDCRIRKHGQSTLNYPIPSFKIWSNSSYIVTAPLSPDNGKTKKATMYGCNLDGNGEPSPNTDVTFYKGRYAMKEKSIPANKWVLQANYADSSGVHNGGIMRLITESWYNAQVEVNGHKYYKLRTPPQLLTSIPSSREGLDEADLYSTPEDLAAYRTWQRDTTRPKQSLYEYNDNNKVKLWSDCNIGDFPYDKIRVSPDSFPCVVFYRETENDTPVFLGQYVFMDDKKSDYIYGERSIYKVNGDPFCLSQDNSSLDKKENRLWNNEKTLRIEVVKITTDIVGYRSHSYNGRNFDDIVTVYQTDEDNNYIDIDGNIIQESELPTKGVPLSVSPNWYNGFELIYPDVDDLKDSSPAGVNETSRAFIDWHEWLVSTYEYWVQHGGEQQYLFSGANYNPSHAGFAKFREEAAEHLDLYKLAAYYICFIRLGLVDNVERNAQLKTYDGKHFHYEPWDADIAMGNQNTGGIKWNPPMSRATNDGSVAAFSGTHIYNGVIDKSNWLWDALESWQYWQNIVRSVADALSTTLTYDNICKVLDEEYAQKWCERIYNISGHFKYIETKGANMYNWLQGARTSHRHWWLKTSMDYYDARWTCGDFKNTGGYMNIKYNGANTRSLQIKIVAASKGYFCFAEEVGGEAVINISSLVEIAGGQRGVITVPASSNLEAKSPFYIYGCNNIRELDLSDIYYETGGTGGIQKMYFRKFIDPVSGVALKVLNIGVPLDLLSRGVVNVENIAAIDGLTDVMRNLEELNIQGCVNNGGGDSSASTVNYNSFLNNTENLKRLFAIGTDLQTFVSNNYQEGVEARVYKGGHYEVLQLPSTIEALEFHDSSWDLFNNASTPATATGLSFWSYDKQTGEIENVAFEDTNVRSLKLYGTTLNNDCAINLLKAFIAKAIASGEPETYTLYFENINLNADYYDAHPLFTFTYQDLMNMSLLNDGSNSGKNSNNEEIGYNFKGYLRLSSIGTSDQTTIGEYIQNIQTLFGENVFTKSSYNDNLVVDFQVSTESDDVFITLSSYRGNCYDAANNIVTEGYADNAQTIPNSLIVRASKFLLPDTPRSQVLQILDDEDEPRGDEGYLGAYVGHTEDLTVIIPEMKRRSDRSQPSQLKLQVTDTSEYPPIVKVAAVNIRHKVYPTSINIDILNSNGQHCYQSRVGNTITSHLNTAVGSVVLTPVYPAGTAEEDKATITGISFIGDNNNDSNVSISPDENNQYKANISYGLNLSESCVNCNMVCRIDYKSGDTLDSLTLNLTIGRDDVVITRNTNAALYNVLNYLDVPAMVDDNIGKVFTKRSLLALNSINFEEADTTSEYYTLLGSITSFLVDTSDVTKGTLFDYIDADTTSINLNGCTNAALESDTLVIDSTRFTKLQSFQTKNDIEVEFTFTPSTINSTLTTLYIYNCKKIEICNVPALAYFDVRGASYVDIQNAPNISELNFDLDIDYANMTRLVLNSVISSSASKILGYVYDYISQSPLPAEAYINVHFTQTATVTMNFMSAFASYIGNYQDYTNLVIRGSVQLSNHTSSVRYVVEQFYNTTNNNVFVTDWGVAVLELVPASFNSYIIQQCGGNILIPQNMANLTNYCLITYHNSYSSDCSLVTNALFLKYGKGAAINQYEKLATWFPNLRYMFMKPIPDETDSFQLGRSSTLKVVMLVTTCPHIPKNINPGYEESELMYKMIIIPSSNVGTWYDDLDSKGVVTSGAQTNAEKIAALEAVGIYCQDANGNLYTETYLIDSLVEAELEELYTYYNPSGRVMTLGGSNSTVTIGSYTF